MPLPDAGAGAKVSVKEEGPDDGLDDGPDDGLDDGAQVDEGKGGHTLGFLAYATEPTQEESVGSTETSQQE